MGKFKSFNEFLASQGTAVPLGEFLLNLGASAVLSALLGLLYVRYGTSHSDRRGFASNFVLVTMATMLVISIVKSSLALSLGMVGALSIVRFRAAIKEPQELAFLFLAIAIGLGFGANQGPITLAAFALVAAAVWGTSRWRRLDEGQNLYLTVASKRPHRAELDQIIETLRKHCAQVSLKRFDEDAHQLEASFLVGFDDLRQLQAGKAKLRELGENVQITFLDPVGP